MAFVVGELAAPITGDTKGFDKDLDRIKKSGEQAAKTIAQRFKSVGQSISNVGGIMTRFVTGPLLAAGAGMLLLAGKTANYADEIDKTSIRTGLARETLQELRFAADQVGVEFTALQGIVESFTRRIPQLESGTGEAYNAFQQLGIQLRDNQGKMRSISDLFPELIRSLAGMTNETERNAVATQIFGRRAFEIVPLLNAGEKGIAELTARAHELNLVMSDEAIKAGVDYKDTMSALKQEFAAIGRELALKFMPIIKDDLIPVIRETLIPMFRDFIEWIGKTAKSFSELDKGTQKLIISLGGIAIVGGPVLKVVGALIKGIAFLKIALASTIGFIIAIPAAAIAAAEGLKKLLESTDKVKNEQRELGNEFLRLNPLARINKEEFVRATKAVYGYKEAVEETTGEVAGEVIQIGKLTDRLNELTNQRNAIIDVNRELTSSEWEQARALDAEANAIERLLEMRERMLGQVERLLPLETAYSNILSGIPTKLEPVMIATDETTKAKERMTMAEMQALEWSMAWADETIKSARDVANVVISETRRMIMAQFAKGMAGIIADAGIKLGIFAPIVGAGIAAGFNALWNRFIPKFAQGGIVPSGFPNDTFPAMLSSGETVIPLDRHKDFMGGKEINLNIHLTGDVRARDNELAYIINQIIKKRARLT